MSLAANPILLKKKDETILPVENSYQSMRCDAGLLAEVYAASKPISSTVRTTFVDMTSTGVRTNNINVDRKVL